MTNLGPLKNIKQDMRTQRNSIRVGHLEKDLSNLCLNAICLLV